MKTVVLRPGEPERDFWKLAEWFSTLEGEKNTEAGLQDYYKKRGERITQVVAEDSRGELVGFFWAMRDKMVPDRADVSLFVKPEERGQGVGRRLYREMERAVKEAGLKRLRISIWDNYPEGVAFAERRGFSLRRHLMAMALNLGTFDDRPYEEIIAGLKGMGFRFTSMEELGNTEDAQRKLHVLNDTAASETPGSEGEHPWSSFEEFQDSVCRSDWYKPGGQMVVIDTTTGAWAAMSAITRLKGNDYAYNLFTGVDSLYRGRKLAQAVKVTALRYARDVLEAKSVHTHHNTLNAPMIAIDRKLGYVQIPGSYQMEKALG
jgi:GNAT superfamily N-acetyltransferase